MIGWGVGTPGAGIILARKKQAKEPREGKLNFVKWAQIPRERT